MISLRPIFGVGCPRSGTTTFAVQMSQVCGVYSLHEGRRIGLRRKRRLPYFFQATSLPPGEEQWNRNAMVIRRDLAQKVVPLRFSESNNTFSHNIHLIEDIFPDAKIIHLVRDPIPFVVSQVAQMGKSRPQQPRVDRKVFKLLSDAVFWMPYSSVEELIAKSWRVHNETIAKTTLPRLMVRTNDLGSEETWRKILDHLEIDSPLPKLGVIANKGRQKKIPSRAILAACEQYCTWTPR